MPTSHLQPVLAADGIFNVRDLGGLPTADGRVVRPGMVVRGDALHRCGAESVAGLVGHGVTVVLDLRDDRERRGEGVLVADGLAVEHHPVLDDAYVWTDDDVPRAEVLGLRYREILDAHPDRFAAAIVRIAAADGGVAYHCAVGKDRTGLLTALLLELLGVEREAVVADYARSAAAVSAQIAWLRAAGHPEGDVSDEEARVGVWSARPVTVRATLAWLDATHGGAVAYLAEAGVGPDVVGELRARLTTRAGGATE